jgi:hypothetical protein
VLTRAGRLWAVADVREPRAVQLPAPAFREPPACLAVLPPRQTLAGGVIALVGAGGTLWEVDDAAAREHVPGRLTPSLAGAANGAPPPAGSAGSAAPPPALQHIAPSPDGALLALYLADGRLLVASADLSRQARRAARCIPRALARALFLASVRPLTRAPLLPSQPTTIIV